MAQFPIHTANTTKLISGNVIKVAKVAKTITATLSEEKLVKITQIKQIIINNNIGGSCDEIIDNSPEINWAIPYFSLVKTLPNKTEVPNVKAAVQATSFLIASKNDGINFFPLMGTNRKIIVAARTGKT